MLKGFRKVEKSIRRRLMFEAKEKKKEEVSVEGRGTAEKIRSNFPITALLLLFLFRLIFN